MDPAKPTKKPTITCNVSSTKYEVIRHVASKMLNYKLSTDEEDDKWDIFWTDTAVQPEKLSKMQPYQKINHFPGMYSISRKNYLAMNLSKLKKKFPEDYNFFPKTWLYPCDYSEIKFFMSSNKNSYLIVKPEASCQGRGIFLTKKIENIDPNGRFVVQEYLARPFLIENLKFDLRVYVLVTGCDPLRIFVHEDGLTRFATEEYTKPTVSNCEDMCMHLTNYAVNKNNPNFIHCEDSDDDSGHKRTLISTFELLESEGYNIEQLKNEIDDSIIKTIISIQPTLAHHYKSCQPDDTANNMCFELLGFDIILDSKLKPYVLEVNHTPSFTTDSPLDWKVKKKVIKDTLVLMNITSRERKSFLKKQKEQILKRAVTGRLEKESKEEREVRIKEIQAKRDKWERNHLGGFRKVFPIEGDYYSKFLNFALEVYLEWTGGQAKSRKVLVEKEEKTVKTVKTVKNFRKNLKVDYEQKNARCSSIPVLVSPENNEKPNATVFERLSKPSIKRFKNTKAPVFPPLVYYDDVKPKMGQYFLQSSRLPNAKIDPKKLTMNSGFRVKLFEFPADKTFDG